MQTHAGVPDPPPVLTSDSPLANGALTHQELQFIAESELVEVVPNIGLPRLDMLCVTLSPLRPMISSSVPLWMAIDLKARLSPVQPSRLSAPPGGPACRLFLSLVTKPCQIPAFADLKSAVLAGLSCAQRKRKCTIKPPEWLSPAHLEEVLAQERADEGNFQPLPFHYIEIATLLFKFASDDFPDLRKSADLFDAIRSVRLRKIESGLRNVDPSGTYIRLANICAMEVNIVRPFFAGALNRFHAHAERESVASIGADLRAAGGRGGWDGAAGRGPEAGTAEPARRAIRRRPQEADNGPS